MAPCLGERQRQRQGILGSLTQQEKVVSPWLPTRSSGNKRPSVKASSPGMPRGSLWQHGASQHQQDRQTASLLKNEQPREAVSFPSGPKNPPFGQEKGNAAGRTSDGDPATARAHSSPLRPAGPRLSCPQKLWSRCTELARGLSCSRRSVQEAPVPCEARVLLSCPEVAG